MMTNETKHTTTPWFYEDVTPRGLAADQSYRIYSSTEPLEGSGWLEDTTPNLLMADTEYYPYVPSKEDAAHIVKCVNAHDDLVSALKQIANGEGYYGAQAKEYKDIARAALKKAGA